MQDRARENCGARYEVGKPWQRYCSSSCRLKAWVLRHIRIRYERGRTERQTKILPGTAPK